jgi:hypothetical protein
VDTGKQARVTKAAATPFDAFLPLADEPAKSIQEYYGLDLSVSNKSGTAMVAIHSQRSA